MTIITNIEDLRTLAQKRVPRMFYEYADSGSWTEGTYRANEADLARIRLRQRVAVELGQRSTQVTMLGRSMLYGLGALGGAGVTTALQIIHEEQDLTMAFCGQTRLDGVDQRILFSDDSPHAAIPREATARHAVPGAPASVAFQPVPEGA